MALYHNEIASGVRRATSEALLRRKGRHDLFKAWIAPQGIPPGHQFQLTIGEGTGVTNIASKLLTGRGVVANPGRDHRKIGDRDAPVDCIFFYWKKLDCSPAFPQCFVSSPKSCVDQAEQD